MSQPQTVLPREQAAPPVPAPTHDIEAIKRAFAEDGFEASLDYATPLVPSGTTLDGDSRIHFGVRYGF